MGNTPKKKDTLAVEFNRSDLRTQLDELLVRYDQEIGQQWQYHLPEKKKILAAMEPLVVVMHDDLSTAEKKSLANRLFRLRTEISEDEKARSENWGKFLR